MTGPEVARGVDLRVVAVDLLQRVLDGGAYTNVAVGHAAARLPSSQRAALQRIVYTTLRMLLRVDRALGAVADRPPERMDRQTRDTLRIAAAELLFLDRAPHAVVSAAVDTVRRRGRPRAAGFVNAVLRRLAAEGEPPLPPGPDGEALRLGVPRWIYDRLSAAWGDAEAIAFLEASNREAPLTVRVRPGRVPIGTPVPGIPSAFHVDDPALVSDHAVRGDVLVADAASIAVGLAVAAHPGERIVDLAAAPGGKTAHLWDAVDGRGLLVAMDRHRRRAATARDRLRSIGVDVPWIVGDARRPPLGAGVADRALLDAPCTGLGSLRRRPEIRHRLGAGDPASSGARQRRMLEAALRLAPVVLYAVCTVFPEETIDVVASFEASPPEGLPGRIWEGGLLLAPHATGTDGMFLSVVRRRGDDPAGAHPTTIPSRSGGSG